MTSEFLLVLSTTNLSEIILWVVVAALLFLNIFVVLWAVAGSVKKLIHYLRTLPERVKTREFWENVANAVVLIVGFAFLIAVSGFVLKLGLCILSVGAIC